MKKINSILLIISIVFISTTVAFADGFNVCIKSKSAKCGDIVEINVDFENNTGIIAAIFDLTYDQESLELIGTEDKYLLDGGVFSQTYNTFPYKMVWNSASTLNFTEDGTLVTLKFKVKDNAKNKNAFIKLTYNEDDVFDVDLNNVAINVVNGSITVEDAKESTEEKQSTRRSNGGSSYSSKAVTDKQASDNSKNQIILTIGKKEATVFGETKINDVAPIIKNDRTMLPARFVAEALGAKVEWSGNEQMVTITKDDVKIIIYIDSNIAYVNNKQVILDSPAFIENNRTYTPLRFVAENLGAKVDWIETTQSVIITK